MGLLGASMREKDSPVGQAFEIAIKFGGGKEEYEKKKAKKRKKTKNFLKV